MNLRRVGVLLGKELISGPKNFLFIVAFVTPIVLSLVLGLLLGTFFAAKPHLGVVSDGETELVRKFEEMDSLILDRFDSDADLKRAVEVGAVDLGMVLPQGFDDRVARNERTELTAYVWGESLLKDRAILGTTVIHVIRELAGQEAPVEIITETVGDGVAIPWKDRIFPLIVLMSIVMGGTMVPASSIIEEKEKRTMQAVLITPTTLTDFFAAKALLGVILSLATGIMILVLNQAFGVRPVLLVFLLVLGAVLTSTFGVLLGAYLKDIMSLMATIKMLGMVFYAPALVYLFPQIPEWVGKVFPTYYIVAPIIETTQRGGGWSDVAPDIAILLGLIAVMFAAVVAVAKRMERLEA